MSSCRKNATGPLERPESANTMKKNFPVLTSSIAIDLLIPTP